MFNLSYTACYLTLVLVAPGSPLVVPFTRNDLLGHLRATLVHKESFTDEVCDRQSPLNQHNHAEYHPKPANTITPLGST